MTINSYLAVTAGGAVRVTKNQPSLANNEIAIGVGLELPTTLFRRPQLQARIVIDDKAITPPVITAETVQGVKHAIEQSTGFNVQINAVDETQGGKS